MNSVNFVTSTELSKDAVAKDEKTIKTPPVMALHGKAGRLKFPCLKNKDHTNHQFTAKSKDKFSPSQKIKYKNIKIPILSKLLTPCIYDIANSLLLIHL